jgi:FecR protein
MNLRKQFGCVLVLCLVVARAQAGPLSEAHVTKIINDVKISDPSAGTHRAKINDVIRDEVAVTTGLKSRSELLFQDNTLSRLGPESYFSFRSGTRDLNLEKGTLLLQVPKGLGGAKIHTAAVTAAITGTTIMMEYVPKGHIKVLVLEGTLRLSINGRFGDSLSLQPGKMVIMRPDAKRIPDPVTVDLKRVIQTSTLVNMPHGKTASANVLPSTALIDKEIAQQEKGKGANGLIGTNLVILGKGTNVLLGSDDLLHDLAKRDDLEPGAIDANPNPLPSGTPPPPPPTLYVVDNSTVIKTSGPPTITTQGSVQAGVIFKDAPTNGLPSAFLFGSSSPFDKAIGFDDFYSKRLKPSAVFTFSTLQLAGGVNMAKMGKSNSVTLVGNSGITNAPAGATVNLGGIQRLLFATQAGDITLDNTATFTGSHGKESSLIEFYARGGNLNISSTFTLPKTELIFTAENNAIVGAGASIAADRLTVTGGQTVQFDGTGTFGSLFQLNGGAVELGGDVTAKSSFINGTSATINGTLAGGNITITGKAKSGTAIAVSSSAQLLALLNASTPGRGGSITFTSAGGEIDINGGTMQADHGTIDVRNNGDSGVINLSNAVLSASTIKVGALGNNGTLNIGGGTISADSLIKLYAGGSSGTVNFVDDVTLSGKSAKIIAGDTVTIFNGKIVTINGLAPVDVFTNHANYTGWGGNSSTTGTFAGQGALTHPLSGAPKY